MRRLDRLPTEAVLAVAVAATVGLLVFPVPTGLIDSLLAIQLGLAVVVLIAAIGARRPLELSTFPAILLLSTLFRLALNVSTTRLILAQGDAGQVVAAFGDAVVAGNLVVGAVVFAVLTIVQYLVIAKGAERVAQVGARFALHGLPGRQLAIDADVRAGLLDPETARTRRRQLARESGLFGAMDGAMKFVRGDAIAGLCIVAVNVIGGLAVGIGQRDLPLDEAVRLYTMLTVGDGLVSQLPAMLTATAAAFLATRVAAPETPGLGTDLIEQFVSTRPLWTAAGLLVVLALLPGLPTLPLGLVACALAALGLAVRPQSAAPIPRPASAPVGPRLRLVLHPEAAAALETGAAAAITTARHRLDHDYGVVLPAVESRVDPGGLAPGAYRIELDGAAVARGVLPPGHVFVQPAPATADGIDGVHPRLGAAGRWQRGGSGLAAGPYLVDHLVQTTLTHSAILLGVQGVADRLARLEERQPALLRAVVPQRVDLARLTWLFQQLLAEGVAPPDPVAILEVLAAHPPEAEPARQLATLRRGLAAQISHRCAPEGHLDAIYVDPGLEARVRAGALDPDTAADILAQLEATLARHPRAAVVVSSGARAPLRQVAAARFPGLGVVAGDELLPGVQVTTVGLLG